MKGILQCHAKRYPEMQAQDYVKLLYQGEFGGGHFISNEADSLARLEAEHGQIVDFGEAFLPEPIGGGLCRAPLAAYSKEELPLLNRMFVATANRNRGSQEGFSRKLDGFLKLCHAGALPLPAKEAEQYVTWYREKDCLSVHHSREYRSRYRPAYRVLEEGYLRMFPLARAIEQKLQNGENPIFVAIEGGSASGKTSCAEALARLFPCNVFHMDDFFLRLGQRTEARLQEAGGNVDYERVWKEVLLPARAGKAVCYQPYDCQTQTLSEGREIRPAQLNLLEGAYSAHPLWRETLSLTLFLSVAPEKQRERICSRNGAQMAKRFQEEWIPLENRYFDETGMPEQSDFILDANWF